MQSIYSFSRTIREFAAAYKVNPKDKQTTVKVVAFLKKSFNENLTQEPAEALHHLYETAVQKGKSRLAQLIDSFLLKDKRVRWKQLPALFHLADIRRKIFGYLDYESMELCKESDEDKIDWINQENGFTSWELKKLLEEKFFEKYGSRLKYFDFTQAKQPFAILSQVPNLTFFKFQGTFQKVLPLKDVLNQLDPNKLVALDLERNKGNDDDLEQILRFTALTLLNVGWNFNGTERSYFPRGLNQLKTLCLSANTLKGLDSFDSLTHVTSLDLRNNKLEDHAVESLARLTNLTSLNLQSNKITADGVFFLTNLKLQHLDLTRNSIGPAGLSHIFRIVTLVSLNLDSCEIKAGGIGQITQLSKLYSLNLSQNGMVDADLSPLLGLNNLSIFKFWGNTGNLGYPFISHLLSLTELDLGNNRLCNNAIKDFSGLVNLNSLNLGYNGIIRDNWESLSLLPLLTCLNLSSNKIGPADTQSIASLTQLIKLDLSSNRILDEGACRLSSLKNLTHLDLCATGITDGSASLFSRQTNLVHLALSCNHIGNSTIEGISHLNKLTWLNVYRNCISDSAWRITRLTRLTELRVHENQVDGYSRSQIESFFQSRGLKTLQF